MLNKIHKGVILAGGLGTRFLPWTAGVSKTMLPLVDKPTIAFIVDEFIQSGIADILIVVGYEKDNIISYFKRNIDEINEQYANFCKVKHLPQNDITINFAVQKKQCGTANAILQAENFVTCDDFAVACGDEIFKSRSPITKQLISVFNRKHSAVVACHLVSKIDATRFGVLEVENQDGKLCTLKNIIEKPPIEKINIPLVNLGRYILPNSIFEYLHNLHPNASGEFALTDALVRMSQSAPVLCYNFIGTHYDIGNKVGYAKAFLDFALTHTKTKKELRHHIKSKKIR